MTLSPVTIQITPESRPSTPSWMGEVAAFAQVLVHAGILKAIAEQVRFARARFGQYDLSDFVAVLIGYVLSGEPTLLAFYERLAPFAGPFMALFGRNRLPHRSTLSRFLAALGQPTVEALRTLFHKDLLARKPFPSLSGLFDRTGGQWLVVDVDGTKQVARQRALPQTDALPVPHRRFDQVCAPGYQGRKRGEVVCTRTVLLQAHTHQWLGTFANPGNGQHREELRRAVASIQRYAKAHTLPEAQVLLRLDGQYGTGAVLSDLAGLSFVMHGKDYQLLDRPEVQARLHLPADQQFTRPESAITRTLYDCPDLSVGPVGHRCRVVVATHPASKTKSRVGVERDGVIYELFLTKLPQIAFTAADVVALAPPIVGPSRMLLRMKMPSRIRIAGVAKRPAERRAWQIISQWVWNLRLELGHQLSPTPMRTTEFAPAIPEASERSTGASGYASPEAGLPWKAGRFSGRDFAPQADGTLRCPAGKALRPTEQRREADGTLRLLYATRIGQCRSCRLRKQCQWHGGHTKKPRRVSVLMHPLQGGSAPLLWRDWNRREHRRACMQLVCHQRVEIQIGPPSQNKPDPQPSSISRAQRAHYRHSWHERLARNARTPTASRPTITLFGVPDAFAVFLGLSTPR